MRGILLAGSAYICWGLAPLFWKQLQEVPPLEVTMHRVLWSLLFLIPAVPLVSSYADLRAKLAGRMVLLFHVAGAMLIAANWLTYIWAVTYAHLVEASLGYFLVPFVHIAAGVFLFRERLNAGQVVATAVAAVGVGIRMTALEGVPWIAFILAGTFGAYGYLRKRSPLSALGGLTVETLILLPVALGFLLWLAATGADNGALRYPAGTWILLPGTGLVTAGILLLFGMGARRSPLSAIAILQFLAPSINLLLAVWVFSESFPLADRYAFALIALAMLLYVSSLPQLRRPLGRIPPH